MDPEELKDKIYQDEENEHKLSSLSSENIQLVSTHWNDNHNNIILDQNIGFDDISIKTNSCIDTLREYVADIAREKMTEGLTSKKVDELVEEKTTEIRNKLATLLDLKIKVLPPFSSGFYLIEFEQEIEPHKMKEIMSLLRKEINKRYNNDSILLVGIRKIEDISYKENYNKIIDNEIKRLEELRKELNENDLKWIC